MLNIKSKLPLWGHIPRSKFDTNSTLWALFFSCSTSPKIEQRKVSTFQYLPAILFVLILNNSLRRFTDRFSHSCWRHARRVLLFKHYPLRRNRRFYYWPDRLITPDLLIVFITYSMINHSHLCFISCFWSLDRIWLLQASKLLLIYYYHSQ